MISRAAFPLVLVALAACTPTGQGDLTGTLPDERLLVNMPMEDDMGGTRSIGDWSELYLMTADVTFNVNGLIGAVLGGVEEVGNYEPSWTDGASTATWGPWDDGPLDPTSDRMWVHHEESTDVYTWAISQRPKASQSDDDWVDVVAGQVEPGATEEVSEGWFAIDFDKAYALDPNTDARGSFVCGYDVNEVDVVAYAAFENFTEDPGSSDDGDAVYHYEQVHGGDGLMDLIVYADQTGNGDAESLFVRSRWTTVGSGRGDAAVTGGELGSAVYTSSECWGADFRLSYRAESFGAAEEGSETSCVFDEASFNDSSEGAPTF